MKRPESWAEARRPTEAEKRRAKQLLARSGFLPKPAKRGTKVTIGTDRSPGAAAPPRSVVDRYASVFEDKKEKRRREEAEGLVEDFARCAEQQGCPHCDLLGEAHLHGATLYEAGRALF